MPSKRHVTREHSHARAELLKRKMQAGNSYLSEILFHFWGKRMTEEGMLGVFDSIMRRGLLLTCGNQDMIDDFAFLRYSTGNVEHLRIRQNARVCFTEVPRDRLTIIQQRFGQFGIGFKRQTILNWGGCPVWYLPNMYRAGTQYGRISIGLVQLKDLIDLLLSMKNPDIQYALREISPMKKPSNKRLDTHIATLNFFASHYKGMSPRRRDDQSFLYEREWRLVQGLHYGSGTSLYRRLTASEKAGLLQAVPVWGMPCVTGSARIDAILPKNPVVDDFYFFNGIPDKDTVATMIDEIILPSRSLERRVRRYLVENRSLFGARLPVVLVRP
jgi:hypothetical protein